MSGEPTVDFKRHAIEFAAQDRDLVARMQLKVWGFTDQPDMLEDRIDALQTMTLDQEEELFSEIRKDYSLDNDEFRKAVVLCIAEVTKMKLASEL